MVEEGEPAPDIELTTDTGERVKLSAFRGQTVVLYYCPKDENRPLLNEVSVRQAAPPVTEGESKWES